MKTKAFTLVEVMIVTAIIVLLAGLAIPGLLRAKVNANDSVARTTLRTISTACENYAAANGGSYPSSITDLTSATPPYLNQDYTNGTRQGFNITCDTLDSSSYSCTATPAACNVTGSKIFTITTGSIFTNTTC